MNCALHEDLRPNLTRMSAVAAAARDMSFPLPITSAALAQFFAVSSLLGGEGGELAELDIPSVARLYEVTGGLPKSPGGIGGLPKSCL